MGKKRIDKKHTEVRKMPMSVIEAIENQNAERDDFIRAQKERLAELKRISSASQKERDDCRKTIVKELQEVGILNRSKNLAKEYR